MIKALLPVTLLALFFTLGCSSSPMEPNRSSAGLTPQTYPFQMAVMIVCPDFQNPSQVPTNVPIHNLIPADQFPTYASFALAAFDVYYEPSDWDDWLYEITNGEHRKAAFEPTDWDDWLLNQGLTGAPGLRKVHSVDSSASWLALIGKKIDPQNLYEPSDWDDWLSQGYQPADWDNWLYNQTIDDIAALN